MNFENRYPLSEAEKKFPSAEYYDRELVSLDPLQRQILDTASPMTAEAAIPAENWMDFLENIESYSDGEYGYYMFDENHGYIANYLLWTNVENSMSRWWYRWININPQGIPKSEGSLHYKIWFPGEHFDHGYLNGKDRSGGYYGLDYDPDGNLVRTERFNVSPTMFGVTRERMENLANQDYSIDCAWETSDDGMHLSLNISKVLPNGSIEKRTRTWFGYGVKDGRVVRDPDSRCTEQLLRNTLIHQSIEGKFLNLYLPELYGRFGQLPEDQV